MQESSCPFQDLPFSSLFKTYVSDFSEVGTFYDVNPFDGESIEQKAQMLEFSGDRRQIVDILKKFNKPFDLHEKALNNLERLQQDDALTIVTGQQLGLYGGPLYTVFKTISAIHLARRLEKTLDRPVIPVFWLADEDHDYEEVQSLYLLNRDNIEEFGLPPKSQPLPAIAEMELPPELDELKKELREALYETDFSDDLWELLDDCFSPGKIFLQAFGQFISRLFSKHGLLLVGSNHPDVKSETKSILQQSISKAGALKEALEKQTGQVKKSFHQQVTLYDSNLFYFSDEGHRLKINTAGDSWSTEQGHAWSTDELLNNIEAAPERFSPNVFLRPILQDAFLPTLGYVAGPGEVAYYGQMKQFYGCFDMEMPVLFPRMSATLIEPAIGRIFDELPFTFSDYSQRIEDLESHYVEQSEQVDIEAIFTEWKQKIDQVAGHHKEQIAEVDATLDGAAGKATAIYFGELDKLKGKVYRAVKQQDQTQLNRIRKIKNNFFPEDSLQERLISPIYFMNKYGVDIWDEVLASLDEDEAFDRHKLIPLQ